MPSFPQFSFALPVTTAYRAGDFVLSSCNRTAHERVTGWPDWPQPILLLHGPAASGKTHLAHIWAQSSDARYMAAEQLTREAAQAIIETGEAAHAWVVEDIGALAAETALFHMMNAIREQGGWLLLTAPVPPSRLDIHLPDLRSRIQAVLAERLDAPDGEVLAAVIHKQFADRQLRVGDDVVRYLLLRMDRSFAAARGWVERIDQAALAERRKVTVGLVRELLDAGPPAD